MLQRSTRAVVVATELVVVVVCTCVLWWWSWHSSSSSHVRACCGGGHATCHRCRCRACMLWWWATALVVIATRVCVHAVAVATELIVVRLAHACML